MSLLHAQTLASFFTLPFFSILISTLKLKLVVAQPWRPCLVCVRFFPQYWKNKTKQKHTHVGCWNEPYLGSGWSFASKSLKKWSFIFLWFFSYLLICQVGVLLELLVDLSLKLCFLFSHFFQALADYMAQLLMHPSYFSFTITSLNFILASYSKGSRIFFVFSTHSFVGFFFFVRGGSLGLNPGRCSCYASTAQLSYIPSPCFFETGSLYIA
jgi:hypothetical protein